MASRGFGSDNHATIHPRILAAILDANVGHAPSYGTDEWTKQATSLFRRHFGAKAEVFFVFNGTAANMLSLRALTRPGEAVLCSDVAHIHQDEAGGPEFFIQGKLSVLPSVNGKIGLQALQDSWIRRGDVHYAQSRVLSLAQPTELGTVYSVDELKPLIQFAKSHGLFVHMDGARLGAAAASLGLDFGDFTTALGVDVVSFGGTKNGLLGGEAVILLNPEVAKHFAVLRKQAGQLPSKSRYIAAQFIGYLEHDTWREIASQSLRQAHRLRDGVEGIAGVEITRPVQSNAVFARLRREVYKKLVEKHFFYVWDEATWECRWMTSWDTEDADTDSFVRTLKELSS